MIRRLLRIGSRIGVFAGVGFALFKVVQNRRTATTRMPSGDNDIVPTRPNQPLVDPSMLQGVELRKGAGSGRYG